MVIMRRFKRGNKGDERGTFKGRAGNGEIREVKLRENGDNEESKGKKRKKKRKESKGV